MKEGVRKSYQKLDELKVEECKLQELERNYNKAWKIKAKTNLIKQLRGKHEPKLWRAKVWLGEMPNTRPKRSKRVFILSPKIEENASKKAGLGRSRVRGIDSRVRGKQKHTYWNFLAEQCRVRVFYSRVRGIGFSSFCLRLRNAITFLLQVGIRHMTSRFEANETNFNLQFESPQYNQ